MSLEEMVNKYIVTAAQYGAPIHQPFLSSLDGYAKDTGAQILVQPIPGTHAEDVLDDRLQQYKVVPSYTFNKNFRLEDFPIKPQQIRPLTGVGRFVQRDKSAVFGSPKQHLEVLPTSNSDLPKILTTTGAVTRPHYREHLRIGNLAKRDHTYGALVVEVDGDWFQYRHITATDRGEFIDLGTQYSPEGKPKRVRADSIVLGDIHTGWTNPQALDASLQMIRDLRPKYVILHDIFDGHSISHHDLGKQIYRAKKSKEGKLSLTQELYNVGEQLEYILSALPNDGQIVVVKSNHDEHLDRYLEEGRYGSDPENLYISSKLATAMLDGLDPLQEGLKEVYGNFGKWVKFLGRDDDFKRRTWQLGSHGDLGGNGSRGSVTSQQINYGKSMVAHRHTPSIRADAWCVGTLTGLKMDYNRGPSGWMNTNGVVYPNTKAQLINVINGGYKL